MRLSRITSILVIVGAILALSAPETAAQMARISGTAVNTDGQPISGVTITITTPDSEKYEVVKTTNKKGRVTLSFTNVERQYEIRLEKAGFQTKTEPLPLATGGTVEAQWALVSKEEAEANDDGPAAGAGGGGSRAVRTYNEGVEAQRLGDLDLAGVGDKVADHGDSQRGIIIGKLQGKPVIALVQNR